MFHWILSEIPRNEEPNLNDPMQDTHHRPQGMVGPVRDPTLIRMFWPLLWNPHEFIRKCIRSSDPLAPKYLEMIAHLVKSMYGAKTQR